MKIALYVGLSTFATVQNCYKRLPCWKYMNHALGCNHFYIYDNSLLVTAVYLAVLKEGEG